jgi:hypothetical protein
MIGKKRSERKITFSDRPLFYIMTTPVRHITSFQSLWCDG